MTAYATCPVCRQPFTDADRSVCRRCVPGEASNPAASYREALTMILQLLGAHDPRTKGIYRIASAALAGADLTDSETVIAVCEGRWRATT